MDSITAKMALDELFKTPLTKRERLLCIHVASKFLQFVKNENLKVNSVGGFFLGDRLETKSESDIMNTFIKSADLV